jgi:hypothetical protein
MILKDLTTTPVGGQAEDTEEHFLFSIKKY